MKSIYIAGPMRGLPEYNYPAFNRAANLFRRYQWDVVNPVEVNHGPGDTGSYTPEHYVRNDLREMINCTAIALLPGWENSTGARCEVSVAVTLGMRFFNASTADEIAPPRIVHIRGGYDEGDRCDSLDLLAQEIRDWQEVTFPRAHARSVAAHLLKEAKELLEHPHDLDEIADIFLLVVGAASANGVDLAGLVRSKLEENKLRTWGEPDADGVVEHIRDGAESSPETFLGPSTPLPLDSCPDVQLSKYEPAVRIELTTASHRRFRE